MAGTANSRVAVACAVGSPGSIETRHAPHLGSAAARFLLLILHAWDDTPPTRRRYTALQMLVVPSFATRSLPPSPISFLPSLSHSLPETICQMTSDLQADVIFSLCVRNGPLHHLCGRARLLVVYTVVRIKILRLI